MQCNSPFFGTGFPNYRQFHPCNSFPHHTIHPEVIGEGDVASVVYPDGSVHFYFIPINKRNVPYCDHNIPIHNHYCNNGVGAFYVRSVSNPMSAAVFNQQLQKTYGIPFSRPCLFSDYNVNSAPPCFQLKFHNDSWTSTTDLRYFFPRLRQCEWRPASPNLECAAVQTDPPAECPNVDQTTCAKPKPSLCPCNSNINARNSAIDIDECCCSKVNKRHSRSSMSCGGATSKTKLRKKKSRLKCKKHKQKKIVRKTSNFECECREPITTDKSVTTYADKASGCTAEERNTQTSPANPCSKAMSAIIGDLNRLASKGELKTELWFPKSSSRPKPMGIKSSEKIIGVYETDCSSDSCCCSTTDTDGRNN